ncbi:copper chaperone [Corynebacterium mustelae]|uniref:Copper chaperone n=1 Tax=Corynebacterium mustelae TaxID=571915 RepID=A0A0G3H1J4_9CORY|nr:heavy-metal-associated domain-containing protein [Corynebacterium mustelae]AKK07281.1 copper chaperone [Corynebacterium mustelae]
MIKNYVVNGMTCQHCVMSVTEEISEIPGVQDVNVDLESGRVTVTGEDFSDSSVSAAVTEAGFALQQ